MTKLSEFVKYVLNKDISNPKLQADYLKIALFIETLSPEEYLLTDGSILFKKYEPWFKTNQVSEYNFMLFFSNEQVDRWFTNRVNEQAGFFYRKKFYEINQNSDKVNPAQLKQLEMLEKIIKEQQKNDGIEYVFYQNNTDFKTVNNNQKVTLLDYADWEKSNNETALQNKVDTSTVKNLTPQQEPQTTPTPEPKQLSQPTKQYEPPNFFAGAMVRTLKQQHE